MATLANVFQQEFDNDGLPLDGGKIYVYDHDTQGLSDIYQDINGTALSNPVALSSSGRTQIYIGDGLYDFVLENSVGDLIASRDAVSGGIGAGSGSVSQFNTITELIAAPAGVTDLANVSGYYVKGDGKAFKQYYWDDASTATHNAGTVIQPLSNPATGRWLAVIENNKITPSNFGAYADGETVDDDYIEATFNYSNLINFASGNNGQYRVPAIDFGPNKYKITKRLIINQRHEVKGTVFICSGDGDGFKLSTNPLPANCLSNPGVDCCFLVNDGGSLDGCTIQADATLDIVGNAGIWLINAQENYGKKPINNVRVNGNSAGKYLNGVTTRFNTTCTFGDFGGSFLSNGFRGYSNNICSYGELFFESFTNHNANKPFEFNTMSHCDVQRLWAELAGDQIDIFNFTSCNNLNVDILQTGDPLTGSVAGYTAVNITNVSDSKFGRLLMSVDSWAYRRVNLSGSTPRLQLDPSFIDSGFTYYQNLYDQVGRGTLSVFGSGIDLEDTLERFLIGFVPNGARLVINVISKSGSITTPKFKIYNMIDNVETELGELSFATFTEAGDRKTLYLDIVANAVHYISPSSGTGNMEIEWDYTLIS